MGDESRATGRREGPAWASIKQTAGLALALLGTAAQETLWPTRCVICDRPDTLLCHDCRVHLPYIDQLTSCPVCGSAWGKSICCECNHFMLSWRGLETFPLERCVSATMLTSETRRMVTVYKDRDEQRLAGVMAGFLADVMPPSWRTQAALVPIPARKQALKQRGFDHMQLVAEELQKLTRMPLLRALSARTRKDQRALGSQSRLENARHSFEVLPAFRARVARCKRIVVVDDVMTTGATLFSAADALRAHTSAAICGLTFARVQN